MLAGPGNGLLLETIARAIFEARIAGEAGALLTDEQDAAQAASE